MVVVVLSPNKSRLVIVSEMSLHLPRDPTVGSWSLWCLGQDWEQDPHLQKMIQTLNRDSWDVGEIDCLFAEEYCCHVVRRFINNYPTIVFLQADHHTMCNLYFLTGTKQYTTFTDKIHRLSIKSFSVQDRGRTWRLLK